MMIDRLMDLGLFRLVLSGHVHCSVGVGGG